MAYGLPGAFGSAGAGALGLGPVVAGLVGASVVGLLAAAACVVGGTLKSLPL